MATEKQRRAAQKNVRKAQEKWKRMSTSAHRRAQPEGRDRKRPGTGGGGEFYRIEVRPKGQFTTFRTQDVGSKGHLERVAGKRSNGRWDTVSWLISKDDAHREGNTLVIDRPKTRSVLKQVRGTITHKKGDIFEALPRKNVPEREKPTPAQQKARKKNIQKARAARASSS